MTIVRCHILVGFSESDTVSQDDLHTPGTYWMEGGVYQSISNGCEPLGEGGLKCPFATTTKANGKFYDICYEMAKGLEIEIETHCSLIETRLACDKVNTCKWTANQCVYTASKRAAKAGKRL